ncbi:hypothetical protein [Amycolatopsis pithecellobii]|nr:hypothetical protein [Amycolatopsis pithecellobii]
MPGGEQEPTPVFDAVVASVQATAGTEAEVEEQDTSQAGIR